MFRILLFTVFGWLSLSSSAQTGTTKDLVWADSTMEALLQNQELDFELRSILADTLIHIYRRHGAICKEIFSRTMMASYLDKQGKPETALKELFWALEHYNPPCDSNTLMGILANFTNIYLSLEEFARVDSISRVALALWNPEWKDPEFRYVVLNNLSIAQASVGDMVTAGQTFRQIYVEAVKDRDTSNLLTSLLNQGSLKGMTGDLDSAYFFLTAAAEISRKVRKMDEYLDLLINLSNVDAERGQYKQAIARLDTTYTLATELKSTENQVKVQKARAELYARFNDFKQAYTYLLDYIELNNQYLSEEKVKAVTEMMEKYESEKKARQIQQLELDKLDSNLRNERITNARNRFIFIGAGILLVAIGIYSRLHYTRRSKVALQKERDVSENLLLNILPAPVAEELKAKGHAEARHFDDTTILFSDFQGFTTVSEILSAAELVDEINTCFKTFDEITTTFGIEKIKTIGDAYMAVGGLNDTTTGIREVVLAAIDMQRFINLRKEERDAKGLPAFSMRVGIHTGPVVAGIVGKKKFQYDIWGDTVNTASRMESHGETGHVNISETTYLRIKDDPAFTFITRGRLQVKGKGEMPMYFVVPAKA